MANWYNVNIYGQKLEMFYNSLIIGRCVIMTYNTRRENKKDFNSTIAFCLILDWGLSFMMWCILFKAHEKPDIYFITSIVAICVIKPMLGMIIKYKLTLDVNVGAMYFGTSTVIYSLMFFWMFYGALYKVVLVRSPLYLVLGAVGYIIFFSLMLYYRCGVIMEKHKDRSGKPNYAIIGVATFLGPIFIKRHFDKLGEDVKSITVAIIALFISYVFSVGGVLLIERWVCRKFRKSM